MKNKTTILCLIILLIFVNLQGCCKHTIIKKGNEFYTIQDRIERNMYDDELSGYNDTNRFIYEIFLNDTEFSYYTDTSINENNYKQTKLFDWLYVIYKLLQNNIDNLDNEKVYLKKIQNHDLLKSHSNSIKTKQELKDILKSLTMLSYTKRFIIYNSLFNSNSNNSSEPFCHLTIKKRLNKVFFQVKDYSLQLILSEAGRKWFEGN